MVAREGVDAEGPRTLLDKTAVSPRAVTSRTESAEFAETEPDLFTSEVSLATAAKLSSAEPSRAEPTRTSSALSSPRVKVIISNSYSQTTKLNFVSITGWDKFCVITVASRKSCQKCRFEACVQIGMEISWVMSEAERQRLLVTRMAKKRKIDCDPAEAEYSMPSSSTSEPSSPVLLHKSRPLQDYLWPLYPDNVNLF